MAFIERAAGQKLGKLCSLILPKVHESISSYRFYYGVIFVAPWLLYRKRLDGAFTAHTLKVQSKVYSRNQLHQFVVH